MNFHIRLFSLRRNLENVFFFLVVLENLLVEEDERGKRSDLETSEDEKRRARIRSLKKKAMSASSKFIRKRSSKRVAPCRFSAISVGDVRDEKEEEAVNAFRQVVIERDLLPDHHDDYHTMLRFSVSLLNYILSFYEQCTKTLLGVIVMT